ncbi:MAG: tetratricopeptide repeat protein [Cyanobacteria bacterium P01_F01_bin.150]
MGKSKRRDRGRMLTEIGWRKIWDAIYQEFPDRQTFAAISRKTDPSLNSEAIALVTAETIAKIINRKAGADLSKIQSIFAAFGLTLESDDHGSAHYGNALPADPNFVGRGEAIAHLHELVHRDANVIVIQARGGIGKTTLARKFLAQEFGAENVIEFPIAKETKDIASIESLLEEKLRQLGEEPGREFMVSCDRLKRKLQSERIGILIDNLEPALDSSGRFIEPHRRYVEVLRILADPSVQSTTLITTRERLRESSITVQTYLLKSLDVVAWKEFFESRSLATDTPALAALHNAYGGNAKAMEIISGAIAQDFEGDVDEYWQENQDDLFIERDLEDLVKQQFERLEEQNPDAYNLLCRMGCYRYQDVPTVPIEGLFCLMWDVPEKEHKRVVKVLRDRSLVEVLDRAYWLHPMIKSEAIAYLRTNNDWIIANQKVALFWTNKVKSIESTECAMQAFEAYYHYYAIQEFEKAGEVLVLHRDDKWEHRIPLGDALLRMGFSQQPYIAIKKVINKVSDPLSWSRLHKTLGNMNWVLGNITEAIECNKKAVANLTNTNTSNCKYKNNICFYAFLNMGICKISIFEFEDASIFFKKSLTYILGNSKSDSEILDIKKTKCSCYLAFIQSHDDQKKLETLNLCEKLWHDLETIGWQSHGFTFHGQFLGIAYQNLGFLDKAIEIYENILTLLNNSNYTQAKAKLFTHLAEAYRGQDKFEYAIESHNKSITLLEENRSLTELAEAYLQRGITYKKIDEKLKSKEDFSKSMLLFKSIKAPRQIERLQKLRL